MLAPLDLLRDTGFANSVKVGEHSIDPEHRVGRLLCLSKTDVKLDGLKEFWRAVDCFYCAAKDR
jgi:hypothetical protein